MKQVILMFLIVLSRLAFAIDQEEIYDNQESLPQPYCEVSLKPELLYGWFVNQEQLNILFARYKINNVIELGSFLGLSTMHIASLLPDGGKCYAVDHWLGSAEHQGRTDVAHLLPTLYEQFLSNIIHNKLAHKVVPVKMTTIEAVSFLVNIQPDLIYVDAAHDEASVYQDLCLYYPKLKKGGIMCGDDWSWETVQRAVVRFAKERSLKINSDRAFWYFEPCNK